MLVRREVFDRIGLLDEGFWAYCEDVDFCWRAWQAGFKVLFCPHAVIIHKIGRSSDQRLVPSLIQHHKSMWRFYLKNYRHRYPLVLFPVIGLGIGLRLTGALMRIAVHRLRLGWQRWLEQIALRQRSEATPTLKDPLPSRKQGDGKTTGHDNGETLKGN